MTWRPAKSATAAQAQRAKELLRATLADGSWAAGKVLAEENGVQYRAAMHPNYNGPGSHPGVEVWTQSDTQYSGASVSDTPWKPDPSRRASPEERELVLAEFTKRGWPREEADAMVSIESGWDPTARNKQGFGGFIGFGPWFRKRWNLPKPVWELTATEQAPLVGRYLDEATGGKRWRYPGDTYLTGAAPAYIGASDTTVVYPQGSKAWEQNPGWRPPGGGDITAGSIRATLLRRLAKGGAGYRPAPKANPTPNLPDSADSSPSEPWSSQFFWSLLLRALNVAPRGFRHLAAPDPIVRKVIRDYQASHGLVDDGLLGTETLEKALEPARDATP